MNEPQTPAVSQARRLTAELLGTFALTFVAAGGQVIAAVSGKGAGQTGLVIAPGLLVMAMIYTLGDVSGAHFNPAITLAFAVRGVFPRRAVLWYWAAQTLGAVAAALLLRALFGDAKHLGAPLPHGGLLVSLIMEAVLTFFLVTVIFGTASEHHLVGHNAALAVGGVIALDGLFAAPISGASMNPALSFGPALVGGEMGTYWIYAAGPILGALLATLVSRLLHGPPSADEKQAAGDSPATPTSDAPTSGG